ncbi:MAG: ubiquinol-cytochrome C reductase complex 14kD subunit [Olpidium bornovanus]|uniref:Complex III subunit 7 n=1 Tax=Olpidium bornovanus TaxID=278681 RepID=A0A8H8DJT2_9FUNG|nr:MAG: ubiquinol-cytochrome C reductase complex 14kD subunit [Olpidium bornovanus]
MAAKKVTGVANRVADMLYEKFGEKYANIAGYRKMGLRFDDLLIEETEQVQEALRRLPEMESYERVFRFRRALHADLKQDLLPPEEWTKPEEVRPTALLADPVSVWICSESHLPRGPTTRCCPIARRIPRPDIPYLSPIIAQVKAEMRERDWYNTWSPKDKKPDFFNE